MYKNMHESSRRVYDENGISPTIHTCAGGNLEPKVAMLEPVAGQIQPIDRNYNKNGGKREVRFERRKDCLSNAVLTHDTCNCVAENEIKVRKLTPKECWRLMDFDDSDFEKAKTAGVSNTQLYKQAGNSIVVAVLEAIFKKML